MDFFQNASAKLAQEWYVVSEDKELEEKWQDFTSANRQLTQKLWSAQSWKNISAYTKWADIITESLNKSLEKNTYDFAKQSFEAQYGKADDSTVEKWIKLNQNKIQRDMYGALTQQALKDNVEFDKGTIYQDYIASTISTPKDTRSFWDKTKSAGVSFAQWLVDTPIWLWANISDSLLWTNLYKSYFWDRTNIKDDAGFWDRLVDTMFSQYWLIDVAFGIGTFATAGAWAPVFASLSAAIKGGGKAIAKQVIKGTAEEVLETTLKKSFVNSWDDIFKAIMKDSTASISELASKEWIDATTYMTRLRGSLRAAWEEWLKKWSKEYKEYFKAVDRFTDTSGLGVWWEIRRSNRWLEGIGDTLGLPTQMIKLWESWWKRTISWSFMGLGMNVAIPATTLLPGVWDWFETIWLRVGGALASQYAISTRTWLVQTERQKFIDQYGVDPEESTGQLRQKWDDMLNYKMRNSLPSEILTGVDFKDRSTAGMMWWGTFDMIANFAPVMWGIKWVGKAYNIWQKYLSPIHMEDNGNIVSHIWFIRELQDIQKMDIDENTRTQKIDELKARVANWDPNLVTTIRGTKELEGTVKQLQEFFRDLSGGKNDPMATKYVEDMKSVAELMSQNKMEEALDKWKQSAKEQSDMWASILSSERVKQVQEKVDVLNTYFNKVRENHGFLSNLTKQAVVNLFTSNVKSPTGAILRWNEELIAAAQSIYSQMGDIAKVMEDTFNAKGKYIMNSYPQKVGENHILDWRIEQVLRISWIEPTRENVIALRFPMVTALTKTQFEMKEFQDKDIAQIFDSVFSDYGIDLNKNIPDIIASPDGTLEKTSLWDILRKIESWNLDEAKKLSASIEWQMNAAIVARKEILEKHQKFLQSNAIQIAQMDRLFSDLTNQLHAQKSRERIEENPFVRSEEIPAKDVLAEIFARLEALEKDPNKVVFKEQIEELKDVADELQEIVKDNPEAIVTKDMPTDVNPNDMPNADKSIATEDVQKNINAESEKAMQYLIQQAWLVNEKIEILGNYMKGVLESNNRVFKQNQSMNETDIDDMDQEVDKQVDNYYKNQQRFRDYSDLLYRWIAEEYNKNATQFFERKWEFNIEALRKYNVEKNSFLSDKILEAKNELLALYSDTVNPPSKAQVSALSRKINTLIEEATVKNFTRDGVIKIAKESSDVHSFERNLRSEIKNIFHFTNEAVDAFMQNQFGIKEDTPIWNIIPFYELYKKTEKIQQFNIKLTTWEKWIEMWNEWGIVFSKDTDEWFTDENGNTTNYRLEWLGAHKLREHGELFYMKDISIDWKTNDSFWSIWKWGNNNIKPGERTKFYEKNIMPEIVKEMESQWLIYVGDFQEEWNKALFIKPKDPGYTRRQALMDLTGIDWDKIDALSDGEAKNSITTNFQKYSKLILWGEINPNRNMWNQFITLDETVPELWQNKLHTFEWSDEMLAILWTERDSQVRHLLIEDEIEKPDEYKTQSERDSWESIKEKTMDGRTYNLPHYGRTLNVTTGADHRNNLYKTATNLWGGQFIKSQDIDVSYQNYITPPFVKAIYDSTDPKIMAIVDFTIKNFGDRWFDNTEAWKIVQWLFEDYKVIDRIVGMSSYKNIFTRGKYLKNNPPDMEFENHKAWEIISTDIDNIGTKAIDFFKTPKDRENEKIKYANQVTRNIHEIKDANWKVIFSQEEANQINNTINNIRQKDYEDLLDFAEKVNRDPFIVIQEIEERFGVKFSSYQKEPFINSNSAENLKKLMTNVMRRWTTSGANLGGNQVDLTFPPDYWRVEHIAQQLVEPEFQHNFIILPKSYYWHIETDRVTMFRYPVVSDKVVNAPKIIWAEDIEAQLWYKLDLWSSAIPSIYLTKRIEGDADWDKVVLVTDPRLQWVQNLINKFADAPKFEFAVSNTEANKKDTSGTIEEILDRTTYDIFQGKANIGIIDKDQTRVERYMQMGLIPDKISTFIDPYSGEKKKMSTHDFLRQVLWVTLQKAVDNKSIKLKEINEIIDNAIGTKVKDIPNSWFVLTYGNKEFPDNLLKIQVDWKDIDIRDIALLNSNTDTKNIVLRWIRNAKKNNNIYVLTGEELKEYRKISANALKEDMDDVFDILNKQGYFSEEDLVFKDKMKEKKARWEKITRDEYEQSQEIYDKKSHSIKNIQKEYQKLMPILNDLIQFHWEDTIMRDPQMRFLKQMEGSFLRDFSEMKWIEEKLNTSLKEVQKTVVLTDAETDAKKEMKTLLSNYTKAKTQEEKYNIEKGIYAIVDKYDVNLDNIIKSTVNRTYWNLYDLMTAKGKDDFFADINNEIVNANLIQIERYDNTVDLSDIHRNFWKVDSETLAKIFEEKTWKFFDNYLNPRERFLKAFDWSPTFKTMVDMGMSINQFRDFADVIGNMEQWKRERLIQSIWTMNEWDVKAFVDIIKENPDMEWLSEIMMTMAYQDIAWQELVKKTQDAYTTVVNSPFTKPNC